MLARGGASAGACAGGGVFVPQSPRHRKRTVHYDLTQVSESIIPSTGLISTVILTIISLVHACVPTCSLITAFPTALSQQTLVKTVP
jgi:hypothetical protein